MSISNEFEQAKSRLNTLTKEPDNDTKLKLYALFKQATAGDCNTPKPGFTDVVNKYKWNAWNQLKKMPKKEAEKKYIELVNQLLNLNQPKTTIIEKDNFSTHPQSKKYTGIATSIEFGNIFKIVFNRPDKLNAITAEMFVEITDALKEAESNADVIACVFTGNGNFFTSGNDLTNYTRTTDDPEQAMILGCQLVENFINAFVNFTKPLIAFVNGPAVGIGLTILGIFDLVIASDKATFAAPFTALALSPEGCSSYTFPRLMGHVKAAEILLFNKKLDATEALERNLVCQIIPANEFEKKMVEKMQEISKTPANSLIASKNLIRNNEREQLIAVNAKEMKLLITRLQSGEFMDAVMKFMSKKSKL